MLMKGLREETTWTPQKHSRRTLSKYLMKLASSYSNVVELEEEEDVSEIETNETYAKQQLSKEDTKTTILRISWNKQDDQLEVKLP